MKQTTANNDFLKGVKRMMNAPIYKRTAQTLNESGEEKAISYLQTFFTQTVDRQFFTAFKSHFHPCDAGSECLSGGKFSCTADPCSYTAHADSNQPFYCAPCREHEEALNS